MEAYVVLSMSGCPKDWIYDYLIASKIADMDIFQPENHDWIPISGSGAREGHILTRKTPRYPVWHLEGLKLTILRL